MKEETFPSIFKGKNKNKEGTLGPCWSVSTDLEYNNQAHETGHGHRRLKAAARKQITEA